MSRLFIRVDKEGHLGQINTGYKKSHTAYGTYIECDHEPTAQEVADCVTSMLQALDAEHGAVKRKDCRVFVKSYDEQRDVADPLAPPRAEKAGHRSVGVRYYVDYPEGFSLDEGVLPPRFGYLTRKTEETGG